MTTLSCRERNDEVIFPLHASLIPPSQITTKEPIKQQQQRDTEYYPTSMKETNKLKDSLCSWTGRVNIVKMFILPKAIQRFNAHQNSNGIFHRTRTNNSNIYMEPQRPQIAKATLRKKKAGGIALPDFKLQGEAKVYNCSIRT